MEYWTEKLRREIAELPETGPSLGSVAIIESPYVPEGTVYLLNDHAIVLHRPHRTRRERLAAWWNRQIGRICRALVRTAGSTSLGRWM